MARDHGDGGIDARGKDRWRLRYRIEGRRYTVTFKGTITEAKQEMRRLLKSGDDGDHVTPSKVTLGQWIETWHNLRRHDLSGRTAERYAELMKLHVAPTLGNKRLQSVTSVMLDNLYQSLRDGGTGESTVRYVHVVLGAVFRTAEKKNYVKRNPVLRAEAPAAGGEDVAKALDRDELTKLVNGFRDHPLFPIVAVAAYTGARRGEILALRWADLDLETKALRIERALEQTATHGLRFKGPKTERGRRTIAIDGGLIAVLRAEREKHLRIVAGVPDGVSVDLSLVKLPADALIFPAPAADFDMAAPRDPRAITKGFQRKARALGFAGLRFHDLRATHETMLLDAGVPVHVVAARAGHDAGVLLSVYARRTRKADTNAAAVIADLSKGLLRGS